jgi:hypothetical protein
MSDLIGILLLITLITFLTFGAYIIIRFIWRVLSLVWDQITSGPPSPRLYYDEPEPFNPATGYPMLTDCVDVGGNDSSVIGGI